QGEKINTIEAGRQRSPRGLASIKKMGTGFYHSVAPHQRGKEALSVVVLSALRQQSRYALYRLASREIYLLLDRKGTPKYGDLVITNSGERVCLTFYRGQLIIGVVTLLTEFMQSCCNWPMN